MKNFILSLSQRARILLCIAAATVMVGGIVGGIAYYRYAYDSAKEQTKEEDTPVVDDSAAKEQQAAQNEQYAALKERYRSARQNISNCIFEDEDERTQKDDAVTVYKDGIREKTLSEDEIAAFNALCDEIDGIYENSRITCENFFAELSTKYKKDEADYYESAFVGTIEALSDEYSSYYAEGSYQKAYDVLHQIDADYVSYIKDKDAEIAAEKAAENAAVGLPETMEEVEAPSASANLFAEEVTDAQASEETTVAEAMPEPVGYVSEILGYVNSLRSSLGLGTLSLDNGAMSVAAIRAQENANITDTQYMLKNHLRPTGTEWWTTYEDLGIISSYQGLGENIAGGQGSALSTAYDVYMAWYNSPGHYANMVKPEFTGIGIALYYDPNAYWQYSWVQEFVY